MDILYYSFSTFTTLFPDLFSNINLLIFNKIKLDIICQKFGFPASFLYVLYKISTSSIPILGMTVSFIREVTITVSVPPKITPMVVAALLPQEINSRNLEKHFLSFHVRFFLSLLDKCLCFTLPTIKVGGFWLPVLMHR